MNYVFLIFTSVAAMMPLNVWAEPISNCSVPLSRSFHMTKAIQAIVPLDEPAPPVVLPAALTRATQIGSAISTAASMLAGVGTTQMAQGVRAFSVLKIVSCQSGLEPEGEVPDWADSPTQLAIGEDNFRYDLGAIIGNWAVLVGITGAWAGVAYKFGAENVNFPGGLIMPVLFLLGGTTTSTFDLFHYGTGAQRAWSGSLMALQTIGMGAISALLHPKFFKARWSKTKEEWVDTKKVPGYVSRYGMLFEDYRGGRQWYLGVETLMTLATGILRSYQKTEEECERVIYGAAALYSAYALSLATLRPNAERNQLIFYGAIAGLEALALSLQAISPEKMKTVSTSIVAAAEWALMIKSIIDIGSNIKSAIRYFCSESNERNVELAIRVIANAPEPRRVSRQSAFAELQGYADELRLSYSKKKLIRLAEILARLDEVGPEAWLAVNNARTP